MAAAAEAMPDGHLNRPFLQYHAARAAALAGRPDEAAAWLRRAWDEDIEALMISFAPYDPAFVAMLEHDGFRGVMALAADMVLEVRPLAGSTYLIVGAGSNVVAQVGDDGVLLVDTGYEPALPALRRALGTLGAERIERLVVTHPHEDHMGATAALGAEAIVLAHPGTTEAMREPYVFMEGVELPPRPEVALPDVEVARDTTFRFNGEEVRLVPTVAHTAGDVTVYFAGSRVAHFGDTYLAGNPMMFPGQADPVGFLDALETLLDSMHPGTIVVGGHEAPTDLAAVRTQIEASRACMALVRAALEEGLTVEATAERAQGRFAPQWVAFFYRLFSSGD
jgi:glyoxylase-like metal-dependent hydrolase (beta-lactamase superfamily II)